MREQLKCCVLVVALCLIASSAFARPETRRSWEFPSKETPKTCGYDSCTKTDPNMLNVHIVPHTHDDVGWLKTVDQYYYGSNSHIQQAGVQYILDSVVTSLLEDPLRKFIYVESAFFFKWWVEQTEYKQQQVKMLVAEGRLEFIGGAWSMNDEATTHYQSLIDQFSWGLRRLNDTFGECGRPKIGWQIDPFGHSREMASMFAQMSYDGLFLGRIHYMDKSNRLKHKEMEMIWRGSDNLGQEAEIFTGALFNLYQGPAGSCWDVMCSDQPFVDNKKSPDYNVDRLINHFFSYMGNQRHHFKTNNIMLTMGGDFHYQDANFYFKNLDKLIKYGNEMQQHGHKYNLMYSTPSCYLKALHESNKTWSIKTDDFFPYASDATAVWTGYFTSRPTVKRYERMGNHFLQICKQLTSFAFLKNFASRIDTSKNGQTLTDRMTALREEMGVMQHHDAVTGTEKQHVANDYIRSMHIAMKGCNENARLVLNELTAPTSDAFLTNLNDTESSGGPSPPFTSFEFDSCLYLNVSKCHLTDSGQDQFMVTVYNPLAHTTFQAVRIPVAHSSYRVRDYRKIPVDIQLVPINDRVLEIPYRKSKAEYEIVFLAQEIPALGYKSYYVDSVEVIKEEVSAVKVTLKTSNSNLKWMQPKSDTVTIGNQNVQATFDVNSGLLSHVLVDGEVHKVSQDFIYYKGYGGHNYNVHHRASGAYIFRPNGSEVIRPEGKVELRVVKGPVVDEVYQRFNDWISQVVRIYHDNTTGVEFEWTVGPIPVKDVLGKEIVSRFSSAIQSDGVFYTDSNGREMITRTRNMRAMYAQEVVAQNYYPLNGKIVVQDERERMAILTDRAQGATSMKDGVIDVMVHRRLLYDDAFGVKEPLNEVEYGGGLIATGKFVMLFSQREKGEKVSPEATERFMQNRMLMPNWLFFSALNETVTYEEWLAKYKNIGSHLTLALPQNVYLMTMEPWKENSYLLRFEHLLEKNEDRSYSQPATFDLLDVFGKLFDIESVRETNLSGNLWLDEVKRFKFRAYDDVGGSGEDKIISTMGTSSASNKLPGDDSLQYSITLNPMQIRTFVISVRPQF